MYRPIIYIFTAITCCGFVQYIFQTAPLSDYIPKPAHVDNATFGNVDEIATYGMFLNVSVDFDTRTIYGSNTLDLHVKEPTDKLVLDSWDLDIFKVEIVKPGSAQFATDKQIDVIPGRELHWKVVTINEVIGQTLAIQLPTMMMPNDFVSVRIHYSTQPTSMALSWMTPEQTSGKKLPYLFSQCESINCRSVAPMQDTPSTKITYGARVVAKNDFVVKMSANETEVSAVNSTHNQSWFKCQIPIPSYLIAIVVGDLEYRSLGNRVGVITEPSDIDRVAAELDTLETLLDETEKFLTPYIWGNYTIVVLPPSFPFGGMENPLLTFASPTIIVGDKSQVYVATHEIAHSWSGNDITCRNWEHFWINEGFTVFEERKVSGILHGKDFAKVEALLGNSTLWTDMKNLGLDNTYSSIHPVLQGDNPDNAFTTVPYEKGFQLLTYLESLVGEDNFQQFLRIYFNKYAQQSITSIEVRETWEQFIRDNFIGAEVNRILSSVDWEEWLYKTTFPVDFDFTTDLSREAVTLAENYIKLGGASTPDDRDKYDKFDSNLKTIFYSTLLSQNTTVTLDILKKIDEDLGATADPNPEVKQRWLPLCLMLKYDVAYDSAHTFISSQGRLKYLTPVYQALEWTGQHDLAAEWFNESKNFYHPIALSSLEATLGLETDDLVRLNAFEIKVQTVNQYPRFRM